MTIVYVTNNAKFAAQSWNIKNNLEKFVVDLEKRNFDDAIKLFGVRFPYRYRRMSNNRVIAKVATVEGKKVICILDILKKGSNEANEFHLDARAFGKKKIESLLDHDDLRQFVQKKIVEESDALVGEEKEDLPESLNKWWYPFVQLKADEIVMESEDWIRTFEIKRYSDFWQSYFNLVNKIVKSDYENTTPIKAGSCIKSVVDENGYSIFYANLLSGAVDAKDGYVSITFLINAVDNQEKDRNTFIDKLYSSYSWLDDKKILESTDEIARHSKRGYPAYVIDSANIWREIQQSDSSNLALSGEESQLLNKIRHLPSGKAVLPVFINGRAGSGKSTILYYLFADYVYRKFTDQPEGKLLFLTYSKPLLKIAKTNVRKLLDTRPDIILDRATSLNDVDVTTDLDQYFRSFLDFLGELSRENSSDQFTTDQFIDFRRFNQLFLGKNLPSHLEPYKLLLPKKGLTPDLCWHVIRTFIKGYQGESYLTPEEYDEIPQKEKSVSIDVYQQVYSVIWKKWYKFLHEKQNFWDSQDLVRKIIRERWAQPEYAVIFCDEAQDFTRVELDLILSLVIYRKYDLGWQKRVRLPFALAGDPFQTLNPTGFRWEAIKASFYDEIAGNLDPEGRGTIEIQYEELQFNYRSEAPIVRFSNLLQLWRKFLFETPVISPQKPWREEQHIIPPRLFILGDTISEIQFSELVQNAILIVPCEQNQEQEFVQEDPLLSKIKDQNVPFSVQSPILAKGQEFPMVILYRFGDRCPEDFFEVSDFETRLSKEYYLNKLYVGATRAQSSLIIVDTKEGKRKLWSKALNSKEIDEFLKRASNPDIWRQAVGGVTPGDYYGMEIVKQDPIEMAEKLRKGGKENNNSDLLRQAMDFYRRAGKENLAIICQAEALEVDEAFKEAGDLYKGLGVSKEVEGAYWKGKCWGELNSWYSTHEPDDELHKHISLMMVSPDDPEQALNLTNFLKKSIDAGNKFTFSESQFQEGVKEALICLLGFEFDGAESGKTWLKLADLMDKLKPLNRVIGETNVGKVFFNAQRYSDAIRQWDNAGTTSTKEYYLARAEIEVKPNDKILWLDLAGETDRLLMEYSQFDKNAISDNNKKQVAKALKSKGRLKESLNLYWQLGEYDDAMEVLKEISPNPELFLSEDEYIEMIRELYGDLINKQELPYAKDLFKDTIRSLPKPDVLNFAYQYIKALMRTNKWEEAVGYTLPTHTQIREIKHQTFPKMTKLSESDRLYLQSAAVRGFVNHTPDTSLRDKQVLSEYFLEVKDIGFENWGKHITIPEMSSAIERTGRHIDALPYYEGLLDQKITGAERRYVQERWLKVKSKQIERAESDEYIGSKKTLSSRKRELENKSFEWNISLDTVSALPDYPSPVKLPKSKTETDALEMSIDIIWQTPKGKIMNQDSNAVVIIDVEKGDITAFDMEVNEREMDQKVVFEIPSWNIKGNMIIGKKLVIDIKGKKTIYNVE